MKALRKSYELLKIIQIYINKYNLQKTRRLCEDQILSSIFETEFRFQQIHIIISCYISKSLSIDLEIKMENLMQEGIIDDLIFGHSRLVRPRNCDEFSTH